MQNLHLQSERDTVEIWPGILNGRKGAVGGPKGAWQADRWTGVPVLTHEGSINIYSIFKMIRGRVLCHLLPFPQLQHVKLQLSCTCSFRKKLAQKRTYSAEKFSYNNRPGTGK